MNPRISGPIVTSSSFVLLSFVSILGACSSSGSDEPKPVASADGGSDAAVSSDDANVGAACEASLDGACGDCMKTSCCDALVACEQDADCAACVAGTDSDACERNSETHERVNQYLVCKGGACSAACIGDSAKTCTGLLGGLVDDACASCMEASCCEQVAGCKGNAVCWNGCFTNHNETKCHGDPDGHALYHAMGACASKSCAKVCK